MLNTARIACALVLSASFISQAGAQDTPGTQEPAKVERPKYQFLRQREDWSKFGKAKQDWAGDVWDKIKYIPMGENGDSWLSFGGHMRLRGESWSNFGFGAPADNDDTFALWRLSLHGDAHINDWLRVFVEGKTALATDRDLPGGRRTLDVDTGALEQAFADFKFVLKDGTKITLRPGRQALMFGKQRLVSPLPWGNSLRRWDGVTAIVESGSWKTSIFWTQFAPTDKHEFNSSDSKNEFWGAYGSGSFSESLHGDLYYLGIDRKTATFNSTAGHEERHTVGARVGGNSGALDFDVEAAYQFGRVGSGDVSAYMLASQIGYKLDMDCKPRLFVGFDYASGDDNAGNDVETFNQLFPLGHAFLGYMDTIGRQNIIDLSGGATATPMERMTAGISGHTLWRESTSDAVYNAGGGVVRPGSAGSDHYVGFELDLTLKYVFDRHLVGLLGYSHFFAGDFIRQSGPDDDIDFAYLQAQYTF